MSNSIGKHLKIDIFGSSHAPFIGGSVLGIPQGIKLDIANIKHFLALRRPNGITSTSRIEDDEIIFLSGLKDNITTGEILIFHILNKNIKNEDYPYGICRPSHADYVNYIKNNPWNDYQGGGQSSGRMSAVLVVIGAICKQLLTKYDIKVASHIKKIYNIEDDDFDINNLDFLNDLAFATINKDKGLKMQEAILKAKEDNDSLGGEIETIILNAPFLGEPYFDSFESVLAHYIFSIGAIKGLSFGDGFDFIKAKGSEVADELAINNDKINFLNNHNGGINGGITNGAPIIFKVAIKPTPSIAKPLKTINLATKENIIYENKGRHDPCIVPRMNIIMSAISYIVLYEFIKERDALWNTD